MKNIYFKLRLLGTTLGIVAACEGTIMLVLQWLLPGVAYWVETVADISLLTLTSGPLLWWQFSRHHRQEVARRDTELAARTAELEQFNVQLKTEVGARERSQLFLNAVLENLPVPVFIKEAKELRFVLWNKAGEQLTGIPSAEMVGKNDYDFFPPADAARNVAKDREALAKPGGLEIPEEILHTRHHGARTVHVWKVAIPDATGQPAFLLGICEDITARQQAAAALEQSHELYRQAITAANAVPYQKIYGADNYAFMGEGIQAITGYAPAEMRTAVWKEIILETVCLGAATGLPAAEATRRILAGELQNWQTDHHIRTRSGELRWISDASIPLRDAAGKYAGSIGIIQDITERKAAAAALAESEERFRSLVEDSPDMIGIYQAGKLVFINTTGIRLWGGQTKEDLLGRTSAEMIHPDDLADAKDRLQRRLAGETGLYPAEVRYVRLDGTIFPVEVSAAPITFAGQPAIQFVARDITERKAAAAALTESEERFRSLVENSPDMIGIYQAGKLVFVNTIGIRLLGGKAKEELLDRNLEQFIHPDDFPDAKDRLQRRLAGETGMYPVEVRYVRLDGTIFPVEVSAAPVTFAGQPAIQIVGRDITERQRAQQQLAENERHLRLILEAVPECVKLVAADGTLLDMNPAGLAMVEADRLDQVVGQCVYGLLPPQYRPMFETLNAAVFGGESRRAEYELVGRKGTHRWVETSAVPMRDGAGRIIAQLAVTRDITQRRSAEESLRLQEAALRSTASVVVITDRQGQMVWVNPAFTKVTGYTAAEVIGQNPRVLKPKDRPATNSTTFYQNLWQTILAGAVWHGEFHNSRKNGTLLIEEASITPVRNESGAITHFVAVKQDITERKQAEAKLAQTQQKLVESSRLAGMAEVATGVLHNVGNVLNSVNVAATCLADGLRKSKTPNLAKVVALLREHDGDLGSFLANDPKGKQVPGYLAQLADHLAREQAAAQKETAELQSHIEHIKEIVSAQQGFAKGSDVTETLNVSDLVETALRLNESSLAHHHLQIIREFEAVPPIAVEKHKALQILVNLLQNAKQACKTSERDEKQMTLRIMNGTDCVRISVSDNGVGIPAENLTRIFSHGFTTKQDGHGFGLHNAANAAREMGGDLKVHSDGPGQGATFTLELPRPT